MKSAKLPQTIKTLSDGKSGVNAYLNVTQKRLLSIFYSRKSAFLDSSLDRTINKSLEGK